MLPRPICLSRNGDLVRLDRVRKGEGLENVLRQ